MKATDFLSQLGLDNNEFTVNYDDYVVEVERDNNLDDEGPEPISKIEFDHFHKKIIIRTD